MFSNLKIYFYQHCRYYTKNNYLEKFQLIRIIHKYNIPTYNDTIWTTGFTIKNNNTLDFYVKLRFQ